MKHSVALYPSIYASTVRAEHQVSFGLFCTPAIGLVTVCYRESLECPYTSQLLDKQDR